MDPTDKYLAIATNYQSEGREGVETAIHGASPSVMGFAGGKTF